MSNPSDGQQLTIQAQAGGVPVGRGGNLTFSRMDWVTRGPMTFEVGETTIGCISEDGRVEFYGQPLDEGPRGMMVRTMLGWFMVLCNACGAYKWPRSLTFISGRGYDGARDGSIVFQYNDGTEAVRFEKLVAVVDGQEVKPAVAYQALLRWLVGG